MNPLAWVKLALGVAAALAIIWVAREIYQGGRDAERSEIEEQNNDAINDAAIAALGRADCNAARLDGQLVRWDFRTAKCVRSEPGG